jgi:hypothetical protein
MGVDVVSVNEIADALLIKISIPPNFFAPSSNALTTCSSSRTSTTHGKHFPPAFSTK